MKKILYILLFLPLIIFGQEQDPCYSINEIFSQMVEENPSLEINLVSGWNMIGYPCSQEIIVSDAFNSIIDNVILVKNNNGSIFMPEFNFNGIGFLEGGQGYKIKMDEFIIGFSFCQSIQIPSIDGCTDCDAYNFNQWANVDDGSCNYDSDGDGVPDSEEIIGCQDSTACNFNELATDEGQCTFSVEGYDCEGNLLFGIGSIAYGGIVFYFDEIENKGLVASFDDLSLAPWGCDAQDIEGANNTSIGWGFQNSLDIVSDCPESPIAASECLNFDSNGFDDWFLPSKEELELLYDNIGQGSELNNIAQLQNNIYWTSTETSNLESYAISFTDLNQSTNNYYKFIGNTFLSRPIRAFGDWTEGCYDENACNYNSQVNFPNSNLCEYPQDGYDCIGNYDLELGDSFQGGIVFYLNDSGQSGLISSNDSQLLQGDEYFAWGCMDIDIPFAENEGIGFGYSNTMNIINNCNDAEAAQTAFEYEFNGYSDWFLPSISELSSLISFKEEIGLYEQGWYWSSCEMGLQQARMIHASNNNPFYTNKDVTNFIIPIRAFGNWIEGCMDASACNYSYNSTVNFSNPNLCEYPQEGFDCDGNLTAQIGDVIQGGYLYYINESLTGGLVASQDINSISSWSGAISSCESHSSNGYNDWFLPSLEQQQMICEVIGYENDFVEGTWTLEGNRFYWSSSVGPTDGTAYFVYTNTCSSGFEINNGDNLNTSLKYRPIRTVGSIIYGCTDSIACNFNANADFDDTTCNYSIPPYDCNGNLNPQIGDELYGGIVFYVDGTGEHGLVAANNDLESEFQWGCSGENIDGANGYTLQDGLQNTLDIVADCAENPIAASECLNYDSNGYNDWYLPSLDQLYQMYSEIGLGSENGNIGGFMQDWYFSSTEGSSTEARIVDFQNGFIHPNGAYKVSDGWVRPIRSF